MPSSRCGPVTTTDNRQILVTDVTPGAVYWAKHIPWAVWLHKQPEQQGDRVTTNWTRLWALKPTTAHTAETEALLQQCIHSETIA